MVHDSARGPIAELWLDEPPPSATSRHRAVVATESKDPPFWNSVMVPFEQRGKGIAITASAANAIGAKLGDEVMYLPIHPPRPRGQRTSTA